jgi:pSer/pThr/pTyr-binding forkhead associated (FHA) protein
MAKQYFLCDVEASTRYSLESLFYSSGGDVERSVAIIMGRSPELQGTERLTHGAIELKPCLGFDEISRRHLDVRAFDPDTSDDLVINDLDSTNGTYVNDQRVFSCRVSPGQKIRLGTSPHATFTYVVIDQ